MTGGGRSPARIAVAAVLLVAALAVRAVPPAGAARPPETAVLPLDEPMQLLRAGGARRLPELDALVADERRGLWVRARRAVAATEGCPELSAWLGRSAGQRAERLLGELSAAGPDEAFAALALLFELTRRCAWAPGVFGGSADAERLGELYAAWLERWAEPSVEDPLLREPALAAAVVYGRVMHSAAEGGFFSDSPVSLERARRTVRAFAGSPSGRVTAFGAALLSRYPEALSGEERGGDFLAGFATEARLWFPDLKGDCSG